MPFTCPLCEGVIDIHGDHCLVCPGGGDRTKRHNLLRNAVSHECASAALSPELEKPGLLRPRPSIGALPEDGIRRDNPEARRPADIYLPRWRSGVPVALDFAVTSGLRSSVVTAAARDGSSATRLYEDHKSSYLDTRAQCINEGFNFIPMVAEAVGGGWGTPAHKVFLEIAKTKSNLTGDSKNRILGQIHQNLGIILHRENARALLRRCAFMQGQLPTEVLSSAALLQGAVTDEHGF